MSPVQSSGVQQSPLESTGVQLDYVEEGKLVFSVLWPPFSMLLWYVLIVLCWQPLAGHDSPGCVVWDGAHVLTCQKRAV